MHVVNTEYAVCGRQPLPRLLGAFVSHNLSVIVSGQARSIGLHVLTNLKGSFLLPAPSTAVALPSTSRLAIQLALICRHVALSCLPRRSLHRWKLLHALCLHPPHPLFRLLALPVTRSSLLFSALLSLSYWHRWKAVQYFYLSLLTRLSHATVAVRSPSARHQTALCSLTLAFAR